MTRSLFTSFLLYTTISRIFHRVILPRHCLERSSVTDIKDGDRINVNGYLTTQAYQNYKDRPWFGIGIESTELKRCPTEHDLFRDVCIVLLTAHIQSHIMMARSNTTFILATNTTFKYVPNLSYSICYVSAVHCMDSVNFFIHTAH